ncbi:putative methyltransferase-domain-containing protein [Tricladium varicosporioides]|nr:putative methyltransferase-domain-containing protein [Hymenoscyphus varicosporioides]
MSSTFINALDLPRLREEPRFEILVQSLESLTVNPSTWSESDVDTDAPRDDIAISRYLTSILKSPLDWLRDGEGLDADERREKLLDLTSQRLAERCGRSAMGEISRGWVLPTFRDRPELKLEIREPPLIGDNLGFKTWGTAWAMAQKLDDIGLNHFSHLIYDNLNIFTDPTGKIFTKPRARILELGSGTGLFGLAAATMWNCDAILTDMKIIEGNLNFNIEKNDTLLNSRGLKACSDVLDWTDPENGLSKCSDKEFEIVLASDPLYDENHPEMVANMIKEFIKPNTTSRAMVAVPLRDEKTRGFANKLQEIMNLYDFKLLYNDEEICRDDWANNGEEVKSWWGVWGLPNC